MTTTTMTPGQALPVGRRLTSSNRAYYLLLQTDGNLVLYNAGGGALWSSDTVGSGAVRLAMQTDGNLVLYNAGNGAAWASNTDGNPGAALAVQDDGNAVLYRGSSPIWSTDTYGGVAHPSGGSIFSKVAHAVVDVANAAAPIVKVARAALGTITNNPIWDAATAGVGLVPGLGPVSAGMAIASGFGHGQSLKDAALNAALNLMPGGAAARAVVQAGVGIASGKSLTAAGLQLVRSQLPPEMHPYLDAGVMMGRAAQVTPANVVAFGRRLAASGNPEAARIHTIAMQAVNARRRALGTKGSPMPKAKKTPITRAHVHTALRRAMLVQLHAQTGNRRAVAFIRALEKKAKAGDVRAQNGMRVLLIAKSENRRQGLKHPRAITGALFVHPIPDTAGWRHTDVAGLAALLDSSSAHTNRVGNKLFSRAYE